MSLRLRYIWLPWIIAACAPLALHAGPKNLDPCPGKFAELASDAPKEAPIILWELDVSRVRLEIPGKRFTGRAIGSPEGPLIAELTHDPASLTFETTRLKIRPMNDSDPQESILESLSDPSNLSFWYKETSLRNKGGIWLPSITMGELDFVSSFHPGAMSVTERVLILDKASARPVGQIGWKSVLTSSPEFEISYQILPNSRNQGYAKEAVAAVAQELARRHPSVPITATVTRSNQASIATLKASGFSEDKSFVPPNAEDTLMFVFAGGKR